MNEMIPLLFQRRKAKEHADPAKAHEVNDTPEPREGAEKPEALGEEADTNDAADELTETEALDHLSQLQQELKEFEKLKGSIQTTISAIEKLVPHLKERKARLVKDMDTKRKGVEQLTQQRSHLTTQKAELLQRIQQTQEQKTRLDAEITERQADVERLTTQIPTLKAQETKLLQRIQRHQQDLTQIDEQITEVESIQKYGIDFVSALVYASQKTNNSSL
jgi:chromosome segregation ATPase